MNKNFSRFLSFLKIFMLWLTAIVITLAAAYYQRTTGPTYPKKIPVQVNNKQYDVRLVRSLDLNEPFVVKLAIDDTSMKARLFYKRFRTDDEYQASPFSYRVVPVHSFIMNRIFKMTGEKGFFAEVPPQPPAGKIQYYIEIKDSNGVKYLMKESPVVIRFKGSVPGYILLPHILFMFVAMLFSTLAGLMAITRYPAYKKYALWTLILLFAGGMILGPFVQKFAFGEFWTGVPFGWDLTDNKTLIGFIFWILAVIMNRKHDRPFYTALAALVLLVVFSIPHSMFGSELNYASGQVTQGIILCLFMNFSENS